MLCFGKIPGGILLDSLDEFNSLNKWNDLFISSNSLSQIFALQS